MLKQPTCKFSKALPLMLVALLLLINPIKSGNDIRIKVITQNMNGQFNGKDVSLTIQETLDLKNKFDIIVLNLQHVYDDHMASQFFENLMEYKIATKDDKADAQKEIIDGLHSTFKQKKQLAKYFTLMEFSKSLVTIVYLKKKLFTDELLNTDKEKLQEKDYFLNTVKKISFDSKNTFIKDTTSIAGKTGAMILDLTIKEMKFVIVNSLFSDEEEKQKKEFKAINEIIRVHRNLSIYGADSGTKLEENKEVISNKYNYMLLWAGDFNVKMKNNDIVENKFKEILYDKYLENFINKESDDEIVEYNNFEEKKIELDGESIQLFLEFLKDKKNDNYLSNVLEKMELENSGLRTDDPLYYKHNYLKELDVDFYPTSSYKKDEKKIEDVFLKFLDFKDVKDIQFDERILFETNINNYKVHEYENDFKNNNSSNKPVSLRFMLNKNYFNNLETFVYGNTNNEYYEMKEEEKNKDKVDQTFINVKKSFKEIKEIEDLIYTKKETKEYYDEADIAKILDKIEEAVVIEEKDNAERDTLLKSLAEKYKLEDEDIIKKNNETTRVLRMFNTSDDGLLSGKNNSLVKMIRRIMV